LLFTHVFIHRKPN